MKRPQQCPKKTQCNEILHKLKALSNLKTVKGMARFGINPNNAYGVSIPTLRKIAKEVGIDHTLARQLWQSGIHETRILASMIDDPEQVTEEQLEDLVNDFDSWDICDQFCSNLFWKTDFAYQKAVEWSRQNQECIKRAGFVLMAELVIHDKKAKDTEFMKFMPIIRREATDNRDFQKGRELGFTSNRKTQQNPKQSSNTNRPTNPRHGIQNRKMDRLGHASRIN